MSSRKIKQVVLACLSSCRPEDIGAELAQYAEKDLVNPLFSALARAEETVRWNAVGAFGQILPRLADQDMEAARIVMRRLLWSLNEESGGIGWGAPEAMAEIMLHHDRLRQEYLHMLISYLRPDGPLEHQEGNFLELPQLQRGLLWGIGRLASRWGQELVQRGVAEDLRSYLASPDGEVRGLAVVALGRLRALAARQELASLQGDTASVRVYEAGVTRHCHVGDLVVEAVAQIDQGVR